MTSFDSTRWHEGTGVASTEKEWNVSEGSILWYRVARELLSDEPYPRWQPSIPHTIAMETRGLLANLGAGLRDAGMCAQAALDATRPMTLPIAGNGLPDFRILAAEAQRHLAAIVGTGSIEQESVVMSSLLLAAASVARNAGLSTGKAATMLAKMLGMSFADVDRLRARSS